MRLRFESLVLRRLKANARRFFSLLAFLGLHAFIFPFSMSGRKPMLFYGGYGSPNPPKLFERVKEPNGILFYGA
jgi:hypothetical protein